MPIIAIYNSTKLIINAIHSKIIEDKSLLWIFAVSYFWFEPIINYLLFWIYNSKAYFHVCPYIEELEASGSDHILCPTITIFISIFFKVNPFCIHCLWISLFFSTTAIDQILRPVVGDKPCVFTYSRKINWFASSS